MSKVQSLRSPSTQSQVLSPDGALPPVPVASSSPIPLQPPAPGPQLPGKEGNGEGEDVVGNATKENEEKNSSFEARNNEMLKVLKECKDQLST